MDHHGCQLLSLLPEQSLVLGLVLHQPEIPAVKNTELAAPGRTDLGAGCLVLDVGQLADVHSADGGHDVAGKPSPVEGEVFFVQPDDVDLHQHEPSGLVRLQGEEALSLGSVHAGRDKSQRDGDVALVDGSIRQTSELDEVVLGKTEATLHLPLVVLERRVLEAVVVEVDVHQLHQEHRCSDDVVALGAVVLSEQSVDDGAW